MKKKLKVFGIIALMLIIGLVMLGCENPSGGGNDDDTPIDNGNNPPNNDTPIDNPLRNFSGTLSITPSDETVNKPFSIFYEGETVTADYEGEESEEILANVTFQWQKDGKDIPGEVSADFIIPEYGIYSVKMSAPGFSNVTSKTMSVIGVKDTELDFYKSLAFGNGTLAVFDDGLTYNNSNGLTFGNNMFIGIDKSNLWKSSDGIDYTREAFPLANASLLCIEYINNKFFVGGYDGFLAYSDDGENWNKINTDMENDINIVSITYGEGLYLLLTSKGIFYSSTGTGEDWTKAGDPIIYGDSLKSKITYIENLSRFIAVTDNNLAWSDDGMNWNENKVTHNSIFGIGGTITTLFITSVDFGNGIIVAGLESQNNDPVQANKIVVSADGKTWETIEFTSVESINSYTYINDIIFADGIFYILDNRLGLLALPFPKQ
jgi:hypothetical protein